jgi:predicted dehydrogenase
VKPKIGLGLIGAGSFGRTLAELSVKIPEFELAAVYDIAPENAARVAEAHQAVLCTSLDALLQRDDVDAVMIASSHDMHHPHTLAAARAGKQIFCEKPMAIDVAQCQEMIAVAQQRQVKLLIGHVTRLLPIIQRLYEILDSGVIGRPLAMKMIRSAWMERSGWWATSAQSGGPMHSWGAHMYDLLASILGPAATIYATAAPSVQLQTDFDDTIFSTVTYQNGAIGTVDVSISGGAWYYGGGIIAERGSLSLEFAKDASWLEYTARGQAAQRETFGSFDQESLDAIALELENFRDMLLYDTSPFIDSAAAMAVVGLMQASYESLRSGQVVQLGPANFEDDASDAD